MTGITVKVDITELEKVLGEIVKDERISEDIRLEYGNKIHEYCNEIVSNVT